MLFTTGTSARLTVFLGLLAAALLLCAQCAAGYSPAPGYAASDFATGFPASSSGWGPIGVAFDQSDALYVADNVDGNLYRFPSGGGVAAPVTTVGNLGRTPEGLAIAPDGALYVARYETGDVIRVDPASGAVVGTVATGIPCATGLAIDPASGDLFVSQNQCGNAIFRISNPAAGPGRVARFATLANVDGLAFGNNGTLYAAGDGAIYAIHGTASATPGASTRLASIPEADGLAFAAATPGNPLPFLIANRIDGLVTRVDLGASQTTTSDIFRGGSRGDFAAVDSHGCLYVTQTDRIVRIAPSAGRCNLQPTTFGTRTAVPSALATECTHRRLTLVDALARGNHVALYGAADRTLVGRTVDIYLRATERIVARARVDRDGFFRTQAQAPPRSIRDTNAARYQARIGGERSLDLKLTRRMLVDSLTSSAGTVTITGHVTRPLAKPLTPVYVERRVSCTKWVNVSAVSMRPDGTFSYTMPAPPRLQAAVYRAATMVRKNEHNPKLFATFTLPRVVALN